MASNSKWSWEDEMLLYDLSHRDRVAKRRLVEKEERHNNNDVKKRKNEKQEEQEEDALYRREERKLFLGGLTPTTVEKDLRRYFGQFGDLVDVQVMRDRATGKSRCFGFVLFSCSFMADAVLEAGDRHEIDGQSVSIKRARVDKPRMKKTLAQMKTQRDDECKNRRSIFVAGLKQDITEDQLKAYFSGFGHVLRAVKLADQETGVKRSYGFVDFKDFGVVRTVMNVTKHFIQGRRVRVDVSRPRIEFSHQTKTVFVGGLEDGIDDNELHRYFSEFGFVTRALRIPNKDGPKRKFGFVDFDDFESVDLVMSQSEHSIGNHPLRVELALPMVADSMYERDVAGTPEETETWMQKVRRKLQYAVPEQGTWGETMDNYSVFVSDSCDVKTLQFKLDRSLIQFVVGMAGRVVEGIANDTNTRIVLHKPVKGAKKAVFDVTGKKSDVDAAQFIFQQIVKSNASKINSVTIAIDKNKPTGTKPGSSTNQTRQTHLDEGKEGAVSTELVERVS